MWNTLSEMIVQFNVQHLNWTWIFVINHEHYRISFKFAKLWTMQYFSIKHVSWWITKYFKFWRLLHVSSKMNLLFSFLIYSVFDLLVTLFVLCVSVAVVVAFFFCWAPFHAQRLLASYARNHQYFVVYVITTYASGILYYLR